MDIRIFSSFRSLYTLLRTSFVDISFYFLFLGGGGKYIRVEYPVIYFAHISPVRTYFSEAAHLCFVPRHLHAERWSASCPEAHSLPLCSLVADVGWWPGPRRGWCSGHLHAVPPWECLASPQHGSYVQKKVPGGNSRSTWHFMTYSEVAHPIVRGRGRGRGRTPYYSKGSIVSITLRKMWSALSWKNAKTPLKNTVFHRSWRGFLLLQGNLYPRP